MFGGQLGHAIRRAKCFNMGDFYSAYIVMNDKIVSGEKLN
jgi:hypothetical protein